MGNIVLKEMLCSLEERLAEHDNSRKEVQDQLQEMCTKMIKEADLLEEKVSEELQESFVSIEERILNFIAKLDNNEEGLNETIKQAHNELSISTKYIIETIKDSDNFLNSYKLKIIEEENDINDDDENVINDIINKLRERLDVIRGSMTTVQNELTEICTKRRIKAEELKKRINDGLEPLFSDEDAHIQETVNLLKRNDDNGLNNEEELIMKSSSILLKNQKYSLEKDGRDDYKLVVIKDISLKRIKFEERKPSNIVAIFTDKGDLSLSFSLFSNDEITILKETDLIFKAEIKLWEKNNQSERYTKTIAKKFNIEEHSVCFDESLAESTVYCLKVRIRGCNLFTEWSDEAELTTPDFKTYCGWKKCPENVNNWNKYSVDENNSRIATNICSVYGHCTITGNLFLPSNKVTSWNIKILKAENNDGKGIFIGVAPFDIDQNDEDNLDKCGWFFDCYTLTLCSGPPHNCREKSYGILIILRMFIYIGDTVGIVMNTINGELSFILNGINYGVAYKEIPLDKPLVPCAILKNGGDSVEIRYIEVLAVQEDNTISVPSDITVKNTDWNSITLAWDNVRRTEYYQIEIDGGKRYNLTTSNTFTVENLIPDTEYTFRIRAMKGNSLSVWSDIIKGGTTKIPGPSKYVWKECPNNVDNNKKYSIDENNPRIATKINDSGSCTIIGNAPLPISKATSWNIKILKSVFNNGNFIWTGVAPFDINQDNKENNYYKCGWYFHCSDSTLFSGPPHKYSRKEYGLRKEDEGEYVHTGDSVGVIMDTTKGELSFVVNEVNYGVAYEGIPLDKPLIPCVILCNGGDTVELDTSEVKETEVDNSIPIPSNISINDKSWDSITLTWDAVEGISFYQIEVNGSKLYTTTTNSFTKRGLLPETEYTFKMRTVIDNKVSEWSNVVKGKTEEVIDFPECAWKECPDYIKNTRKYSVNEDNPRIATLVGFFDYYCTIVGNTPLPINKVTSWNIKILKSKYNNGKSIYVGVAPFDIDQNEDENYNKCGWYFDCWESKLYSGPPHNYSGKSYGPRKGDGKYIHTGGRVGVIMDTTNGELSFSLYGVNYGVAYEGIPLDKPLVPCVIFRYKDDSVELVI